MGMAGFVVAVVQLAVPVLQWEQMGCFLKHNAAEIQVSYTFHLSSHIGNVATK